MIHQRKLVGNFFLLLFAKDSGLLDNCLVVSVILYPTIVICQSVHHCTSNKTSETLAKVKSFCERSFVAADNCHRCTLPLNNGGKLTNDGMSCKLIEINPTKNFEAKLFLLDNEYLTLPNAIKLTAVCFLFKVLTGEDWNEVMYTAIRSKGGRAGGGVIYGTYFVILLLCGDWTLLNVFLAIACDSLDQAAELTAAEEAEIERQEQEQEAARLAEQAALGAINPQQQ